MQDSFNDIIQRYREYIDQLWSAICQGQDLRPLQRQFEQHMQQNMARYWQPISIVLINLSLKLNLTSIDIQHVQCLLLKSSN